MIPVIELKASNTKTQASLPASYKTKAPAKV